MSDGFGGDGYRLPNDDTEHDALPADFDWHKAGASNTNG